MLYFGMSYQFDMKSDSVAIHKRTKFTEYEDIEEEKIVEEKSRFGILWDKVCAAVPYVVEYSAGFLTGLVNSVLPVNFSDYSKQSDVFDVFREGLHVGDIAGAAVGIALMDTGSGGLTVGTTAICTGAGFLPGLVIDVGAGLVMGLGSWMVYASTKNALDKNRYKASSSNGSGGSSSGGSSSGKSSSGGNGGGSFGGGGKKPSEPYNRRKHYGDMPKKSDRKQIGGESVDHDPPLVKRYYEGDPKIGEKPGYKQTPAERKASANDRSGMKPSTKAEQNKQGGEMSKYSKEQKKKHGL